MSAVCEFSENGLSNFPFCFFFVRRIETDIYFLLLATFFAPFLFCFIGRWSELRAYTCRVSGLAEIKSLVIDLVLSSFNMLHHSVFGSLPKCNSNANFLNMVCGVFRITFRAKSNAFPNGSPALILVEMFSFKVRTPRSTRPVGM